MTLFERIQLVSAATALYGVIVYYVNRHNAAAIYPSQWDIEDVCYIFGFSALITAICASVLFALSELFYWVATGTGY